MTDFLLIATVLLVSGVIAVPLATKLGLGSVLGYLIAGISISPVLAILHVDVVSLQHFAEFGVVMMLFLVGLELEPKKLWTMRDKLLGLGGLQVVGTALIVMMIAMALGQTWSVALAIGLVFALSSTAIVLQTLNEKRLLNSDGGQSSFSVLLFQDIAVIPMLAFIPLLALPELAVQTGAADAVEQGSHGISLVEDLAGWQVAIVTVISVAFVLFVGTHLTRPLFRFIALAGLREMFTAAALMMVIGIALLMSLVGLSPALGTFLAGVVLANSEYRHELEADINPFKGLLLGLFFITVGASINFDLLFSNLGSILALTIGLMLVKALVLYVLALVFKLQGFDRWLIAIGLAQAGEFGFVLLSFTVANHVIPAGLASQLMLVVALSMLLTPICFILLEKVSAARLSKESRAADEIDESNDIIIVGNGRVGGLVRRILYAAGYNSTVVDYSASQLEMLRQFGVKAYFGDGRNPDLLHAAGIDKAKVLVIAIDDKQSITELARHVCKHHPQLYVVARAVDRFHVYDLWAAGCRDIIRETYDSSLRMGRSVFEALGYSRDDAQEIVDEFNQIDRKTMVEMASLYRPDLPTHENKPFTDKVKELSEQFHNNPIGKGVSKNIKK
ncbi:MAG: potassium transporter [Acidithiobacillales bacterium SG8_45]|jgi:CPA2 family monovalent cation:H+ antiporter-2|nr:MAG: potassium transporter [Acidithiobacillales bacterium SG8_45]